MTGAKAATRWTAAVVARTLNGVAMELPALNASTATGRNANNKSVAEVRIDVVSRQRGEVVEVAQRNLPGEVAGCLQRCLSPRNDEKEPPSRVLAQNKNADLRASLYHYNAPAEFVSRIW